MSNHHTGACHCGAVTYAVTLDLAAGSTRCNCSFCGKNRMWMAFAPRAALTITTGEDALTDYRHTPAHRSAPFLHLFFCRHCGVRPFARGGHLPALGGEFYAVNVATLDLTPAQRAAIPVRYVDGAHDDYDATPAVTSYL